MKRLGWDHKRFRTERTTNPRNGPPADKVELRAVSNAWTMIPCEKLPAETDGATLEVRPGGFWDERERR